MFCLPILAAEAELADGHNRLNEAPQGSSGSGHAWSFAQPHVPLESRSPLTPDEPTRQNVSESDRKSNQINARMVGATRIEPVTPQPWCSLCGQQAISLIMCEHMTADGVKEKSCCQKSTKAGGLRCTLTPLGNPRGSSWNDGSG